MLFAFSFLKYKPVTHLFNRPFVWLCLIPSSNAFCAIRSQAFLFSPHRSFRRSAACLDISIKSPAFPFSYQCLSFQKYIRANQVYNFPSYSLPDCHQLIPYFLFRFIHCYISVRSIFSVKPSILNYNTCPGIYQCLLATETTLIQFCYFDIPEAYSQNSL